MTREKKHHRTDRQPSGVDVGRGQREADVQSIPSIPPSIAVISRSSGVKAVPLEICQWKPESVVDPHERGRIAVEFTSQPLGQSTPRPVPTWAWWGSNRFRSGNAVSRVYP